MAEDNRGQEIVRELVGVIEHSINPLHRCNAPSDMCRRMRLGLAFSKPEDCTCGLDNLLSKAREFTGDQPSDIPAYYYREPVRR